MEVRDESNRQFRFRHLAGKLRCTICRPHRWENATRVGKHGAQKPKNRLDRTK